MVLLRSLYAENLTKIASHTFQTNVVESCNKVLKNSLINNSTDAMSETIWYTHKYLWYLQT